MDEVLQFSEPRASMLLLLLLVLPAALAWDPAEGDVPWQPDEIALFELVSSFHKSSLVYFSYPDLQQFRWTLSMEPSMS